jgi:serine/threonine protein kinase
MSPLTISKNRVLHDGHPLELGHYDIKKEISRGANGVVYEAEDTLLQRRVAIKIWTKLKAEDRRDKVQQGLLEARKAFAARRQNVVEIFHAGITQGLFFLVMELVDGVPLKNHLQQAKPQLGWRLRFTNHILDVCDALHAEGIYHGDLHSNNILVRVIISGQHEIEGEEIQEQDISLWFPYFKMIDFGTSYFAHKQFSMKRYFKQVISLSDELSNPLPIREIFGYAYPVTSEWKDISRWIRDFGSFIPQALLELGYSEFEPWLYENEAEKKFSHDVPAQFVENMKRFLGDTRLSSEIIGDWRGWEIL